MKIRDICVLGLAVGMVVNGCEEGAGPADTTSHQEITQEEEVTEVPADLAGEFEPQADVAVALEPAPAEERPAACNLQSYCQDSDLDGYPVLNCKAFCQAPKGYVPEPYHWLGDCDDSNPNVHPGGREVCDKLDNDCSGVVDDNIPSEICYAVSYLGVCSGKLSCTGGVLNCDAPPATPEICDGIDNNCNLEIDEGLGLNKCASSNEYGHCPGEEACINGEYVCNAPFAELEICDLKDNNCNGIIDDIPGGCCPGEIKVIEACPTSDIVFVIDATTSMNGMIQAVKEGITEVVEKIVEGAYPSRLGLIAFRDTNPWDPVYPPVVSYGFADNPEQFKEWVGSLEVYAGGDEKENQLPAIVEATQFDWGPGHLRNVVLVTDAPFHQNNDSSPYNIPEVKQILIDNDVAIIGVMCGNMIPHVESLADGIGLTFLAYYAADLAALTETIFDELNLKVWLYCDENLGWVEMTGDCAL